MVFVEHSWCKSGQKAVVGYGRERERKGEKKEEERKKERRERREKEEREERRKPCPLGIGLPAPQEFVVVPCLGLACGSGQPRVPKG